VEGLIQGMVGAGLPKAIATVFASFDSNTQAGGVAEITDDFKKLTSRAPGLYKDWLLANQAAIAAA
jgi:NAD(P)H dehydrogenase (quinone)